MGCWYLEYTQLKVGVAKRGAAASRCGNDTGKADLASLVGFLVLIHTIFLYPIHRNSGNRDAKLELHFRFDVFGSLECY